MLKEKKIKMTTQFKNYATRTEAVRALGGMAKGESILLTPYNTGAYQQESGSLKACAIRLGMKVELKQALMVIEGEIPVPMLRVTRGGDFEIDQKETRQHLRDEAADLLEQAELALQALVDSYSEEQDGKFSACHPRMGINSSLQQLIKLRKAVQGSKV